MPLCREIKVLREEARKVRLGRWRRQQVGDRSPPLRPRYRWTGAVARVDNRGAGEEALVQHLPRESPGGKRALEADTTHTDISDISEIPFYGRLGYKK